MLVPVRKLSQAEYDALCALPTISQAQNADLKRDSYTEYKGKPCMERTWVTRGDEGFPVQVERCEVLNGQWKLVALYVVETK
jgi:hypothetical protein